MPQYRIPHLLRAVKVCVLQGFAIELLRLFGVYLEKDSGEIS